MKKLSYEQVTIKMLDIKTPDWQENEELYYIRMREFVDGIQSEYFVN